MKSIELTWYQRITLWLRVGGVQAPNMQVASVLYRVIEKIRPADWEREEASLITRQDGAVTWTLPGSDITYGTRVVDLEEDEAKHLAETMEAPQQVLPWIVNDMIWVLPLVDTLKGRAALPASEQELAATAN